MKLVEVPFSNKAVLDVLAVKALTSSDPFRLANTARRTSVFNTLVAAFSSSDGDLAQQQCMANPSALVSSQLIPPHEPKHGGGAVCASVQDMCATVSRATVFLVPKTQGGYTSVSPFVCPAPGQSWREAWDAAACAMLQYFHARVPSLGVSAVPEEGAAAIGAAFEAAGYSTTHSSPCFRCGGGQQAKALWLSQHHNPLLFFIWIF